MGSLSQRNNALQVQLSEPLPQVTDFFGLIDSLGGYTLPVLFGDRLRELRSRAELTQEELATKAQVSPGQVSRWERGEDANPGLLSLQQLATALAVEIADFFPRPDAGAGHDHTIGGGGESGGVGMGSDSDLGRILERFRVIADRDDPAADSLEGDVLKAAAILNRAVQRIGR